MRRLTPLESDEMKAITQWREIERRSDWRIGLLTHIPNGGHRHKAVAAKLKAEGVQAGFPDWIFPIPDELGRTLYIEQKTKSGGLSDNQKWWSEALPKAGNLYLVSRSVEETIAFVRAHLRLSASNCGR